MLAQSLASTGATALTFDWPGAGDAAGEAADADLDRWLDAADLACETLRRRTGVRRLALIGQGFGAAVATRLAERRADIVQLALLAPLVRGRVWLRELAVWGLIVAENLHLERPTHASPTVAGYAVPPLLAGQVQSLDLTAEAAPRVAEILIAARAARPLDNDYAAALRAKGRKVEVVPFEGYETLVSNPTEAYAPTDLMRSVTRFVASAMVKPRLGLAPGPTPEQPAVISGGGFVEETLRLGEGRLIGVECRPLAQQHAPRLLILNAGRDPREGWGRSSTQMARALAREGVASLRIDGADIGDSPAYPDGPASPLYTASLVRDAVDAIDFMLTRGEGPIVIYGRCSGAWAALTTAFEDPRVSRVILANPRKYVVKPDEGVEAASEVMRYYRRRVAGRPLIKRLARREIDLRAVAARLSASAAPLARSALGKSPTSAMLIRERLDLLLRRGVDISIVVSDGSEAVGELNKRFGENGHKLRRWPNVRLNVIARADHCFTQARAQGELFTIVRDAVLDVASAGAEERARETAGRARFAFGSRLTTDARSA